MISSTPTAPEGLAFGDGQGRNPPGFKGHSGIQTARWQGDFLRIAGRAVSMLENARIPLDRAAWVLCMNAWERAELTRESDAGDGGFLIGDGARVVPMDRVRHQLWGRPVVTSTVVGDADELGWLMDFCGSMTGREDVV